MQIKPDCQESAPALNWTERCICIHKWDRDHCLETTWEQLQASTIVQCAFTSTDYSVLTSQCCQQMWDLHQYTTDLSEFTYLLCQSSDDYMRTAASPRLVLGEWTSAMNSLINC